MKGFITQRVKGAKSQRFFSEQRSETVPLILRPFAPLQFSPDETLELEPSDKLNVALSADVVRINEAEAAV